MNSKDTGQSLIEVVIALAIVGLIAVGLVKISTTSIRNARYASEQAGAVALGEKKLAELRVYAANNSITFWTIKMPVYADSGTSDAYCWLFTATLGLMPTETTPRYSESSIADVKVYVFWDNIGNFTCSSLETGLANYGHYLEFSTLIVR